MPTVHVNDIDIYYEIRGEGKPLILIWGIGGEIPPLVDRLAETPSGKNRIIVFDNRGSGRSDKPDIPYSINMMADDTAGLMDAIGIRQAHVFGISTGARIALALAARHPEKVKNLILHVAACRSPEKEDPGAEAAFERLRVAMTTQGFAEKMLAHPPTVASFLRQFEALKEFDGRALLGTIRAPTLIVNATKDVSTPVRFGKELLDGIPDARLILVEGDHLIARTSPDLLVPAVLDFLKNSNGKLLHQEGGTRK